MAFHEDLRNHRLKKGLIIEEISEETKINPRILQALEQGDFHILPIPYVRLFMKAYAEAIDYPVEDILRGLENELQLTGEQGDRRRSVSDIQLTPEVIKAANSDVTSMLSSQKVSTNSTLRLIAGIAVLILLIFVGKNFLRQSGKNPPSSVTQVLPAMDTTQILSSQDIGYEQTGSQAKRLHITSTGFLSIVKGKDGHPADTLFLENLTKYEIEISDSLFIRLFPSENANIAIGQDTLPLSPFNNSWLVLTIDSTGGTLTTFPAY